MIEAAQLAEAQADRREVAQERRDEGGGLGEQSLGDEAVDEVDVRHPARVGGVVDGADRLDRVPHALGRDDDEGAAVDRGGVDGGGGAARGGDLQEGAQAEVIGGEHALAEALADGAVADADDVDRGEHGARGAQEDAVEAGGAAAAGHEGGERVGDRVEGEAGVVRVELLPDVDEAGGGELLVLVAVAEVEVTHDERVAGALGEAGGEHGELLGPLVAGAVLLVAGEVDGGDRERSTGEVELAEQELLLRGEVVQLERERPAREEGLTVGSQAEGVGAGGDVVALADPRLGEQLGPELGGDLLQGDDVGVVGLDERAAGDAALGAVDVLGLVEVVEDVVGEDGERLEGEVGVRAVDGAPGVRAGVEAQAGDRGELGVAAARGGGRGGLAGGRDACGLDRGEVGGGRVAGAEHEVDALAAVPHDQRAGLDEPDAVPGDLALADEVGERGLADAREALLVADREAPRIEGAVEADPSDDVLHGPEAALGLAGGHGGAATIAATRARRAAVKRSRARALGAGSRRRSGEGGLVELIHERGRRGLAGPVDLLAAARVVPAKHPRDARGADVGVGLGVGGVAQGLLEGDEGVAAAAEHRGDGGEVIGVELVGVEQEDVGDRAAEHALLGVLVEGDAVLDVGEEGGGDPVGERAVAAGEGVGVDEVEHPVGVVEGDGGDRVLALGEEGLEGGAGGRIRAGVQEGVTKPAQRLAALGLQGADRRLTGDHVGLVLGERGAGQRRVGGGVVAELEASGGPQLEDLEAGRSLVAVAQLRLVDEADGRHARGGDAGEQVDGQLAVALDAEVAAADDEVVDRDSDGAGRGDDRGGLGLRHGRRFGHGCQHGCRFGGGRRRGAGGEQGAHTRE
jgi:hypothetical protein